MKRLIIFSSVLGVLLSLVFTLHLSAGSGGCYLCEGGGYVKYTGSDDYDKRKKAKDQFGCKVSGTTGSCSNPKGTVN